ncbi:MAG: hypothetical protein IPH04_22295 [Saprospirales bacterium]|nr:hypothetical protein [Saprospirales bacterium]MBK7334841.1 hypothetical protein [Saprospirales bacterium]
MSIQIQTTLPSPSRVTAWTIIAANLVPLIGVLFRGWDAMEVAFLYWSETIIIGAFQVVKILITREYVNSKALAITPEKDREEMLDNWQRQKGGVKLFMRWFLAAFFVVHYGFFIFVQGMILFSVLLTSFIDPELGGSGDLFKIAAYFLEKPGIQSSLIAIGVAHLVHFLQGVLFEKSYLNGSIILEFIGPYKRIFIQQLVVIFGAPLILVLGAPAAAVIVLVLLKTWFDLRSFRKGDEFFWLKQSPSP